MPTIGEYRKQQAERFAKEKQARQGSAQSDGVAPRPVAEDG